MKRVLSFFYFFISLFLVLISLLSVLPLYTNLQYVFLNIEQGDNPIYNILNSLRLVFIMLVCLMFAFVLMVKFFISIDIKYIYKQYKEQRQVKQKQAKKKKLAKLNNEIEKLKGE